MLVLDDFPSDYVFPFILERNIICEVWTKFSGNLYITNLNNTSLLELVMQGQKDR